MVEKRLFSIFMLLVLCVGLFGCNTARDDRSWGSADVYKGAFSDTGYFYLAEGYLYYADFAAGVNISLCPKVGCKHNNELTCEGWVGSAEEQMFCYGDKLYYLVYDMYGTHLYRRNLDGTGLATVATLCEDHLKELENCHIKFEKKVVSGGYLYYTAEVRAYESVNNELTNKYLYTLLMQLDLKTGKEKTILMRYSGITLVAAKGSRIRYILGDNIGEVDISDLSALKEAYKKTMIQMVELDTVTGKEKVLFEKSKYDFFSLVSCSGNKLIYLTYESEDDYTGIYRVYDISTGKDAFFYEGAINNLIAGRYSLSKDPHDPKQYVLLDLENGKELPCHSFYDSGCVYRLVSASDEAVILRRYPRPENGVGNITEQVYSYVPVAALEDGLQETDFIDYYIER